MKAGPLDESLIIQSFKDADLLADPANAVLQEAAIKYEKNRIKMVRLGKKAT